MARTTLSRAGLRLGGPVGALGSSDAGGGHDGVALSHVRIGERVRGAVPPIRPQPPQPARKVAEFARGVQHPRASAYMDTLGQRALVL